MDVHHHRGAKSASLLSNLWVFLHISHQFDLKSYWNSHYRYNTILFMSCSHTCKFIPTWETDLSHRKRNLEKPFFSILMLCTIQRTYSLAKESRRSNNWPDHHSFLRPYLSIRSPQLYQHHTFRCSNTCWMLHSIKQMLFVLYLIISLLF